MTEIREHTQLRVRYAHMFEDLKKFAKTADKIDNTNVYQEANKQTRAFINSMLADNLLPGSTLKNLDNFEAFYNAVCEGKRALLLVEHFSNMDLPALCYLLEHCGKAFGPKLSEKIVAIAGMKLNEANPMVKAWAEAFTRIVVYPSRSLSAITDPEELEKETAKSRAINMASMRALDKCKKEGKAVLVFPSGTRYRPGHSETRQGLREIDSYLRLFDVMILVSINGSCLRINTEAPEDMLADLVCQDTVIMSASPVIECKKFRDDIMSSLPDSMDDKKPAVVQKIMDMLKEQHDAQQSVYLQAYKNETGKDSDYYV